MDKEGEDKEEIAIAAKIEADYKRSRQLIWQAETERILKVIKEAQDVADFEAELDKWNRCYIIYKVGGGDNNIQYGIDKYPRKGSKT